MKKLAVFFPGIGYTIDKPLMYYSRKLAGEAGFDIVLLPYGGFPNKMKGDKTMLERSSLIALSQAKEILSNTRFSAYDTILFTGKSIGTTVAAVIAADSSVSDRIHFLLYTPLENTFSFPLVDAVVFTGSADPWVKDEAIPILCRQKGIPCHIISNANHSLETGNIQEDIVILKKVMKKTDKFIRHL